MASGKYRRAGSSKTPKRRSAARQLQTKSLRKDQENIPPPLALEVPPLPTKPAPNYRHELQKAQRKIRHLRSSQDNVKEKLGTLQIKATQLEAELKRKVADGERVAKRNAELQAMATFELSREKGKFSTALDANEGLRDQNRALQKRIERSAGVLNRSIERAQKKPQIYKLTHRGTFTAHARQLARTMVGSGCSRAKVGPLMQKIGDIFGIKIPRAMSSRTVSRAVLEA
ncbi:hypothetical protein C8J57DRAFT_1228063 [Mycena rebaudengoi]|nr:hypothetical protein C8J57DRAFT_1228063 [Mycena rebaudengoi]